MKQINNGFCSYYYLTEDGKVININNNKYLKINNYNYVLMRTNGTKQKISLKKLYKLVYNKIYCIDNIKDLQGEQWKVIKNTNDNYYVSNYGRIKSYTQYNAFLLIQYNNERNYKKVTIVENGTQKHKFVHLLVAQTFLKQPNNENNNYQVHHKDKNTMNNNVDNLEYLTIEEHYNKHFDIVNKK